MIWCKDLGFSGLFCSGGLGVYVFRFWGLELWDFGVDVGVY